MVTDVHTIGYGAVCVFPGLSVRKDLFPCSVDLSCDVSVSVFVVNRSCPGPAVVSDEDSVPEFRFQIYGSHVVSHVEEYS